MFYNIQALRAVAALMVVFDHWGDHYGGSLQQVGLLGSTGVDIFFVISGFVMIQSTWDRPTSPASFAIGRFVRIVPLYWICTIAVFVAALAMPSAFRSTGSNVVPLVKSLAFVPYLKASGQVQPLLFPGWTLNYEMFFYALFAISLLVRARAVRAGLLVAGLVALIVVGQVGHPSGVIAGFYTRPILLEFGYGVLLGIWNAHGGLSGSFQWSGWGLLGGGFGGLLAMEPIFPQIDRGFKVGPFAAMVVLAAVLLERSGVVVRARSWLLLGAASYALYLVHPFAGTAVFAVVRRLALAPGASICLSIGMTLAVTIAAGVCMHLWIERPADRWLRARLGVRRASAPVPSVAGIRTV